MITMEFLQAGGDVFMSIAETSETTAQNTTLGTFDYVTLLVAVIALGVSVISVCIAQKTLKFQEKTSNNTVRMDLKEQIQLLTVLLSQAYVVFVYFAALKIEWKRLGYDGYPYVDIQDWTFPQNFIQIEACSAELDSKQRESLLSLERKLKGFNKELERRFSKYATTEIPMEVKKQDSKYMEYLSYSLMRVVAKEIQILKQISAKDHAEDCMKAFENISGQLNSGYEGAGLQYDVQLPDYVVGFGTLSEEQFERLKEMLQRDIKTLCNGRNWRGEKTICIMREG